MVWKPFKGVGGVFGSRLDNVSLVAMVMMWRGADVPAEGAMGCPGLAHAGFDADQYFCTECAKGVLAMTGMG
jgi:hypothetical protein